MGGCSYTGNSGGGALTEMLTPNCAMLMAGSNDRRSAGSHRRRESLNMVLFSETPLMALCEYVCRSIQPARDTLSGWFAGALVGDRRYGAAQALAYGS